MKKLCLFFSCLLLLCWSGSLCGYFSTHQILIAAEPAMHISCANLIVEGAMPYIDFVDNATPVLLYLFTLPVLLSKLCFLHPILIFNLLIVLLTIVVFALITAAVKQSGSKGLSLLFYLPALTLSVITSQLYLIDEYGQESMVFMLLFLPYLLERYLSSTGAHKTSPAWRKIFAGVLAALALLLNPIYLLAVLVVEIVCLTALGEVTLFKIRHRYLGLELLACLGSMLAIVAILYLSAPLMVSTYLGPITNLNLLSYDYFYDNLGFVGKSPDRRDLVYAFVVFFIMALPAAGRCLLVRLMCTMAALGFTWLVCSGTLYTHQAFIMTAFVISAFYLALARYLRSMRSVLFEGQLFAQLFAKGENLSRQIYLWQESKPLVRTSLLAGLPVLCFVTINYFCLKNIAADQFFSLANINYYGFGLKPDLSFFSDTVEKNTEPKDLVWIFSSQVRPGFPLITQLRRRPGYLVWAFPLHPLKILHERSTPEQALRLTQLAQLTQFEAGMIDHLRSELNSVRPPRLILIEDGEIWDSLKAAGICTIIEGQYDNLEPLTPLNGDEIALHRPYEYVGHRLGFSAYKLKK